MANKPEFDRNAAHLVALYIKSRLDLCTDFCMIVGSIRRKRAVVHDIDLLVYPSNPPLFRDTLQQLGNQNPLNLKTRFTYHDLIQHIDIPVDINVLTQIQFEYTLGAAILHHTGSAQENIRLRRIAKSHLPHPLILSQYGLRDTITNELIAGETEESIYAALNEPYKPPTDRDPIIDHPKE